jgi:hypothetical protein
MTDDILDDLFHGCAFAAFIEQSIIEGGTPSIEATRCRAYRLYEEALAERNRDKTAYTGVAPCPVSQVTD